MKQAWNKMSPKHKRLTVIALAFSVFAGAVGLMPSGEKRDVRNNDKPPVGDIITDRENGDLRYERLQAQLDNMRGENRELTNSIERMRRDMQRMEVGEVGPTVSRELDEIKEKLMEIQQSGQYGIPLDDASEAKIVIGGGKSTNNATESPLENGNEQSYPESPETLNKGPRVIDEPTVSDSSRTNGNFAKEIWENTAQEDSPEPSSRDKKSVAVDSEPTAIRIIGGTQTISDEPSEAEEEKEEGVYIPAGSILTGTLVTGMDAPTGQGARKEPYPALLRIKHEAILPNRFRADVRECFVIMGGYGDLSSERAYLRGETISCVRKDGKVIESSLDSYTVGEDGKAGIRGRLVNKQGQVLAKAMTAGILQGFASAFGSAKVPTLSVEGSETPLYQQAFSSDALQSGAASGASTALDRLAQFYIDQADGMYPVVEIDAGREIELVMVRGGMLALK